MKEVFIKYNPYRLVTEITIDGMPLADNSALLARVGEGARLQEWVEELPKLLVDEYADKDFKVTFHGTLLDYEDLQDSLTDAYENGTICAVELERIPAKETKDKEAQIDKVFEKIQSCRFKNDEGFAELCSSDVINAFELAKSSDFEVCVVATMSSGKSTLINAMLGDSLMPSKQEACTAIITRIKDAMDGRKDWLAEVYDKSGDKIETIHKLDYEKMVSLNSDENVSRIEMSGDIPFVNSDDISLVLIDTPGPNNSRDPEHKKVQQGFLNKSSKSLVLYIMTGTFGSDDDFGLLHDVADSMNVNGKQSKDRFIFVVNKMDDRRKEDGTTEDALMRVREYLSEHGIKNPNLFPIAALPALQIRMLQKGAKLDDDTLDEIEFKSKKLNRRDDYHFEQFASLPKSVRDDIEEQLNKAEVSEDEQEQALIHTGVVSVEAAIRQYVHKYAKTAKIKNIVDTFMHKLDALDAIEKTKNLLASHQEESKKVVQVIEAIRQNIDDGKNAQGFADSVEAAKSSVRKAANDSVSKIVTNYERRTNDKLFSYRGRELSVDEAKHEYDSLKKFAQELEPKMFTDLNSLIDDELIKTGKTLVEQYKAKLASLSQELSGDSLTELKIEPLKLMSGAGALGDESSIRNFVSQKDVKVGERWVKNEDKHWWNPFTWFDPAGSYEDIINSVDYVRADEMAQTFLAPLKESVYDNGQNALMYMKTKSEEIANKFQEEFKRLDDVLKHKLDELERYASEKDEVQARIEETEQKLAWLNEVKGEVESILAI